MTKQEFAGYLKPAALALGVELDDATVRAYHKALADIPTDLVRHAFERAVREPANEFAPRFPTAPTLRQWAEEERQRFVTARAWAPCEACEESPGWVEIVDAKGVKRLTRCACWLARRAANVASGMAHPVGRPAAARAAREDREA